MTGAIPGATPDAMWPPAERELARARTLVRRLQQRIVKATQRGQQGKVKALQFLLTSHVAACPQDSGMRWRA
jgi:hypothetical protein